VPCSLGPHRSRPVYALCQARLGKAYRAAVLEFDLSRLPQRIEEAEAAIVRRSRSLSKPPSNHGREQDAIARARHILSLLREAGQKQ
jgi:hypothetical protein